MEVWKLVAGYEEEYEVSNLGRVRSIEKKRFLGYGKTWRIFPQKILKQRKDKGGYSRVCLYKSGKSKLSLVHRVVLETFVGPCPGGMECCHNDGDQNNNYLDNLRWDTHENNVADMTGARGGIPTLTIPEVRMVKRLLGAGVTDQQLLAREFEVDKKVIYNIATGRTWKYITL